MPRLALAALSLLLGCATPEGPDVPGVFILGVDGMDPTILTRLIEEGRMPEFERLAGEGTFQPLGTSTPPQSPVAWSSFITGMNPGGHGIFDFVHRDPATYLPISSAVAPQEGDTKTVRLGGYYLPLKSPEIANNRGGVPFWDYLADAGVDVEVYRIPGNYPTPPSEAKVLGGMGTVDMRGGYGTYTWYTDEPILDTSHLTGDIRVVTVQDNDLDGIPETVRSTLTGPPDLFHLPPGQEPGDDDYVSAPVSIVLDPEEDVALITAGESRALVAEGEWSPWMTVTFETLPAHLADMTGGVRFYAKQLRPHLEVYAAPVQIWPDDPAQVISSPEEWATEVYEEIGGYHTVGLPEEVSALKDKLFDDGDYMSQVRQIQDETQGMLEMALRDFEPGDTSFVYMSDLDLQCHMLWRHGDPKYPGSPPMPSYEPELAARYAGSIERLYEHVDDTLGHVRAELPEGTVLIVMSDHGFEPQRRNFHLNAWLRDHGWLVLNDGKRTGYTVGDDVDWSRTRAYGLGFNGLYLNLEGREAQGIVSPEQAEAVSRQLVDELVAWVDPGSGASAVRQVDLTSEVYSGERLPQAPDLIVGYDSGYACSDESTLGEITELVVEDNTSRWAGNHLMSPELVPGVLLVDRPLGRDGHDLTDLPVSILDHYGLPPGEGMVGTSIFDD